MSASQEKNFDAKDLVYFSTGARKHIVKNDYNFLVGQYEHLKEVPDYDNDSKYRVWGLPFYSMFSPIGAGLIGALFIGEVFNLVKKRPRFSSLHVHLLSGLGTFAATDIGYRYLKNSRLQKELIIWDYVKLHPEEFPEVSNQRKKFKDVLRKWYPNR